jgi:ethanolamine ammonia-lyase large subunit
MDREQPAVLGRLDNITSCDRRQCQVAAYEVEVVARQQDDVAGAKHETLSVLTVGPDPEFTLDDVVIKDQVRCWSENGRAMFGPDAGGHTPRREEVGVKEHTASQTRHSQDVG